MPRTYRFGGRGPLLWLASGPRGRRTMFSIPRRAHAPSKPDGSNGPPYQSSIARSYSRAGSKLVSRKFMKPSGPPTPFGGQHRASPTKTGQSTSGSLPLCPSFVRSGVPWIVSHAATARATPWNSSILHPLRRIERGICHRAITGSNQTLDPDWPSMSSSSDFLACPGASADIS